MLSNFADKTSGVSGSIFQYTKFQGFIDVRENRATKQTILIGDSVQLDRQTDQERESLTKQFSNLEAISAQLQSKQAQLTAVLSSIR